MTAWTGGEVRAMAASLFSQDPDNIVHVTVTAGTRDKLTVYYDSATNATPWEDGSASPDRNRALAAQVALNLAGVIQDILEPFAREGEPG